MEDEGFVDDDFIEEVARDYVMRHGFNSIPVLQERAALARTVGDSLSADMWDEIVRTAEHLFFPFGQP